MAIIAHNLNKWKRMAIIAHNYYEITIYYGN